MFGKWKPGLRELGLRVSLLAPLILVGLVAAVGLGVASIAYGGMEEHDSAVHETREAIESITDRLQAQVAANEALAQVLATSAGLGVAVQVRDSQWIGQLMAPSIDASGIERMAVYPIKGSQAVYFSGYPGFPKESEPLIESARTGRPGSLALASDLGLQVISAVPINEAGNRVGVLVTGRSIPLGILRGEPDEDRTGLALFHAGKLASLTGISSELSGLLSQPGLIRLYPERLEINLSTTGFHGIVYPLEGDTDSQLLILVSLRAVEDLAASRSTLFVVLIVSMLIALVLVALGVSRAVTHGVKAVLVVAQEMASGDYERRVPLGRIKELNQLAIAINNLASQLQSHVAKLSHQAFYDHLTGLPNRALFVDRLRHALKASARRNRMLGVLFLDLDNFKVINDSFGHQAGDQLLIAAAGRLEGCLREGDTVARLGGDEFTILLEDIVSELAATATAERIQERLKAPFILEDREVYVSASIGVAIAERGKPDVDELLRDADLAMYRAKTSGKSCYEVFDRSLNERAMERLALEADLRRAIDSGEFVIYYQPIVSLRAGRITGMEALLRWAHPTKGLLSPAEFIPLAEESSLIIPIGRWVLLEACWQARRWQLQRPMHLPISVSVNVSGRQFQSVTLVEDVARALRESGLAPSCLKLEITESVLMEASESTRSTLGRLKSLGVRIVIDDFGTGYSSLAYLKNFPVEVVKIDRSFIKMIGNNLEDTAIVTTIVGLAKTLDLVVTGEGVETEEQLENLQAVSCDEGQGYLFSPPVPADAVVSLLESYRGADDFVSHQSGKVAMGGR